MIISNSFPEFLLTFGLLEQNSIIVQSISTKKWWSNMDDIKQALNTKAHIEFNGGEELIHTF